MSYHPNLGFWTNLTIWCVFTVIFGTALWLAIRWTKVGIDPLPFVFVVMVSSLATLIPEVGQFLCFWIAVFLIYKFSDAESQNAFFSVFFARAIVVLLMLGLYSYLDNKQQAAAQAQRARLMQMMINASSPTNSASTGP
jgi:hypothetical protein